MLVDLEELPVAAVLTRDGVFVAVNCAYEELTGWSRDELLGKNIVDLLPKIIAPRDIAILRELAKNRTSQTPRKHGTAWVRGATSGGRERPLRVDWRLEEDGRAITLIYDASPEAFGQEVTENLARVAGSFSRCASEDEVLERACETLAERGFIATVLLWDDADPLLRYGPSRAPGRPPRPIELPRVPRETLTRLNPRYLERRAAFFLDGLRVVRDTYPEPIAEQLRAALPAQKMVQAPIFLGDAPFGALVVTGDALTPLVATALELFSELVGKAIESIRLRHERVERERMAALGEAAAVMAHEVRNPVGAIKNALALLERRENEPALLAIISEETSRLAQVVSQLLELGRPLAPSPCAFAMEELVGRAVHVLTSRGELGARALELPRTEETRAWLDPNLAELALVNVLRNAVQSTSPSEAVRVRVETREGRVRCVVEDEGPGIPQEIALRAGQPFVTTRATGTGMGFAVVRRIMEASAGRVVIESVPRGARVVLEFPAP